MRLWPEFSSPQITSIIHIYIQVEPAHPTLSHTRPITIYTARRLLIQVSVLSTSTHAIVNVLVDVLRLSYTRLAIYQHPSQNDILNIDTNSTKQRNDTKASESAGDECGDELPYRRVLEPEKDKMEQRGNMVGL